MKAFYEFADRVPRPHPYYGQRQISLETEKYGPSISIDEALELLEEMVRAQNLSGEFNSFVRESAHNTLVSILNRYLDTALFKAAIERVERVVGDFEYELEHAEEDAYIDWANEARSYIDKEIRDTIIPEEEEAAYAEL